MAGAVPFTPRQLALGESRGVVRLGQRDAINLTHAEIGCGWVYLGEGATVVLNVEAETPKVAAAVVEASAEVGR